MFPAAKSRIVVLFLCIWNLSQQSCKYCHTSRNSLETALLPGKPAFCNVFAI